MTNRAALHAHQKRLLERGDRKSIAELMSTVEWFIRYEAGKMARRYQRLQSADFDDLCAEGRVGALIAATRYRTGSATFLTYAAWYIRAWMMRWAAAFDGSVTHPAWLGAPGRRRLEVQLNERVTVDGEPGRERGDVLPSPWERPDEATLRQDKQRQLQTALASLAERERNVVLGQLRGLTMPQIARERGVSRQAVQQVASKAFRKLRNRID